MKKPFFCDVYARARLKSNGMGSFFMETNKMKVDKELYNQLIKKFPDIENIESIQIVSKESKNGFPVHNDFWAVWNEIELK